MLRRSAALSWECFLGGFDEIVLTRRSVVAFCQLFAKIFFWFRSLHFMNVNGITSRHRGARRTRIDDILLFHNRGESFISCSFLTIRNSLGVGSLKNNKFRQLYTTAGSSPSRAATSREKTNLDYAGVDGVGPSAASSSISVSHASMLSTSSRSSSFIAFSQSCSRYLRRTSLLSSRV